MTMDIKNFHLNTLPKRYKYLRLKLSDMPEDVTRQYGLAEKETKYRWMDVEIRKGMYGLPQRGLLAQKHPE